MSGRLAAGKVGTVGFSGTYTAANAVMHITALAGRPLARPRLLRPQGTFRRYRVSVAARLLGLLATAACR